MLNFVHHGLNSGKYYPIKLVKQKSQAKKLGRNTIFIIVGIVVIGSIGGYYAYQSFIPVNVDYPVFLSPENILIKTGKTVDGHYSFGLQSSRGGKQTPQRGMTSPTLIVSKGNLVSVHVINEILNTEAEKSIHNFNIDEFNVHSKDLGYFESQSITFLADTPGEFIYHCTLHPEMKGQLIIK
jgi:hypothetical protein